MERPREPVRDLLQAELRAWDHKALVERPLGRGVRNEVWEASVRGSRCVARRSSRPVAALEWELDLLDALRACGIGVPATVVTLDGRRHVEGLVVSERIEGRTPSTSDDWRLVLEELRRLHAATREWSQRPTFRSARELLTHAAGGDVRLDLMPADVVEECRSAWRAVADQPASVVHGDPGTDNILIRDKRVVLIDWDESRVDASILDLAALPVANVPGVDRARLADAQRAGDAWEVAVGWFAEPAYARRRLAELRERTGGS
jgi:Ser/Thr protein kinase RdoA (MazF antagonist)